MKRIISWLESTFSRQTTTTVSDQSSNRVSVEPDNVANDEYTIETSVGAVMPDIYGDTHEATEPLLKILDPPSTDIDKSAGFDPYDTVVLHEKQGIKKD